MLNTTKKITIKIDKLETKASKKRFYLQEEGFSRVKAIIDDLSKIKEEYDVHSFTKAHNNIFINGERGSGKTNFLLNIRSYLVHKNRKYKDKLHFFQPIDPTILHENESFLTIILAKILNSIMLSKELNNMETSQQKTFYDNLSNISEAIDGIIENQKNSEKTSLEHISQDQSSLQLEKFLDTFFNEVIDIFSVTKLVLLIDDIDMAFSKGFEILEVVRKYLSSSHIIIILTGDIELYEKIIYKHFHSQLLLANKEEVDKSFLDRLSDDYLIKIMPQQNRIQLDSLYDLGQKYRLDFKYQNKIFYFDNSIDNDFFKFFNQILDIEESNQQFLKNLFSNPLRRILQYLNAEHPFNGKRKIKNTSYIKEIERKYNLILLDGVKTISDYIDEGKELYLKKEYAKVLNMTSLVQSQNNYEVYTLLANSYAKTKKYETAHSYYQKAQKINKTYNILHEIGFMLICLDKYDDAIKIFKESIALNLNQIDIKQTNYYLAFSYFKSKNYLKAIPVFKNIIDSVNNAQVYYYLAHSYKNMNDIKSAIQYFKVVISINTKHFDSYIHLASIFDEQSEYLEASKLYEKILDFKENDTIYFNLANLYYKQGKLEKSFEFYEKISSKDSDSYNNLAISYHTLYEDSENKNYEYLAELNYQYGLNLETNYYIYNNLAILYKNKSNDESASYYDKAQKKVLLFQVKDKSTKLQKILQIIKKNRGLLE